MKPCSRHSSQITDALKKKGLWHVVDQTPAVVQERAARWLAGNAGPQDVDPLIITLLEINKKAVETCGDYLLSAATTYCPLCEVERTLQVADAGEQWVDNCTDAVLLICKVNGVVPMGATH